MKKIIFFLAGTLSLLNYACTSSGVKIKGEGFTTHQQVVLKAFEPDQLTYIAVDSVGLSNQTEFAFTVPFAGANLYQLQFDAKQTIPLSVTSAVDNILVQQQEEGIVIQGSEASQKIMDFPMQNEQLQAKYFGALKKEMDAAMAAGDQSKLADIQKRSGEAIQAFLQEFRALITELGPTPAGYYALQFSDFNKEIEFIEQRLQAFQEHLPDSPVTQALTKQVKQVKATALGERPPVLGGKDRSGKVVNLNDYRGQTVLIDFWAAWCRACRVENPKLAQLYEQYHDQGFTILSISQDETAVEWEQAITKDGIGAWQHLWDQDRAISQRYSVSSLPQNVVLDAEGEIIAKNVDAQVLAGLLEKTFKKPNATE